MPPSIISANLQVVGNLTSEGELQIDGSVEGDVAGQSVAVGEKARVRGEIAADEVVVFGVVEGRIRAARVQIARTARVVGDIWHDTLSVEAGAHVEGHLKRLESEQRGGKLNLVSDGDAIRSEPAPAVSKVVGKTAAG